MRVSETEAWLTYWVPGFIAGFGLGLLVMFTVLGP